MGGYGSGFRGVSKATVEGCYYIDAGQWQREGILGPFRSGHGGGVVWPDPVTGERRASIGFESDCAETFGSVRLHYAITRHDETTPLDYNVGLTTTRTPWGKLRWWFICPLVVNQRP